MNVSSSVALDRRAVVGISNSVGLDRGSVGRISNSVTRDRGTVARILEALRHLDWRRPAVRSAAHHITTISPMPRVDVVIE